MKPLMKPVVKLVAKDGIVKELRPIKHRQQKTNITPKKKKRK